ncbi:MAG: SDR family NAD(P)-dependent oxidoreductase [Candidatus Marinimicrobia bacterium]|jgi:NAD(P)-dependent dehydrogenase (short-subunit alcohol dehydrogenase family)|nr:SDR family NAD(P)-dependent oxidoreductase [Candidatus Neomarinimicrobiota bacterium]MBT3630610.1 SDR family NAD(P)-dependent oxidoreductase [Candidatus Neomarinimicrobiota bacterium]MBT3825325.1 SDR family NAD(P)-dependent oxidoreductase [Candidatus Neomarinimicrobiota bacterium]MBT4129477.1 SDR family NAD(P)-dependent oxidoreductase [Candidatus Neomarinimicrobiota bacterium]MBT4295760.1 SDR family NAD(P)-dependent oxidoreductase [Candidatus Neomarinimicrobiota bacterium]
MIVITGASKGIGKYLFNSFLNNSSESVIGTYLNTKPETNLENYVHLDVCNWDQVNKFVSDKKDAFSNITLINCAGISYTSYTHKSDPEAWKKVIETNLFGTYNLIRALLPIMRDQKYGRVINFASVVAVKPTPGISAYAASKSALWGMAKSLAIENASLNITINNINLGYSELGMISTVPDQYKQKIIAEIPAGILCEPGDILKTVEYLRDTRYITGASLDVSGGLV